MCTFWQNEQDSKRKREDAGKWEVKVSHLEIYNEQLIDLLGETPLSVREVLHKEEIQRSITTTSRKLYLAAKRRGTTMKLVKRVRTHQPGDIARKQKLKSEIRENKLSGTFVERDAESEAKFGQTTFDTHNYHENASIGDEERRKRRYRELHMENQKSALRLRHNESGNFVQNLTEIPVRSAIEILTLLEKSVKRRMQAETLCQSSPHLVQAFSHHVLTYSISSDKTSR